ncbi:hypothetical protein HDU67_001536 [Dinochytrium kinnereticum]|nr:hypothetical protein HDU67_001536 [Dinochytrium kinnereticum]
MPEALPIQRLLPEHSHAQAERPSPKMGAPHQQSLAASDRTAAKVVVATDALSDSSSPSADLHSEDIGKMRVLLVDNYDSYTYNLLQICQDAADLDAPVVIRNDQFDWETLRKMVLPHFDCVIISPGPGTPDKPEDFGVCRDIILKSGLPVLGVCLGHQGIASCFGAKVVHASVPMHGRLSVVRHSQKNSLNPYGLFSNIPENFSVVRYHSLVVMPESLPDCLIPTAWATEDSGVESIMALEHRTLPLWGVQFHPESICTDFGSQLLRNFRSLARHYLMNKSFSRKSELASHIPFSVKRLTTLPEPLIPFQPFQPVTSDNHQMESTMPIPLHSSMLPHMPPEVVVISFESMFADSQRVFVDLFGPSEVRFWLDSAKVEAGRSRFSYMGALGDRFGINRWILSSKSDDFSITEDTKASKPLDFPFFGGLVGYFGYEMKAESLTVPQSNDTRSDSENHKNTFKTMSASSTPDAAFMFADRFLVFDHELRALHAVSLERNYSQTAIGDLKNWLKTVAEKISKLSKPLDLVGETTLNKKRVPPIENLSLAHNRERYIDNITKSLNHIRNGETYEVCLTTHISGTIPRPNPSSMSTLDFYLHLRSRNAAPYASYLDFGKRVKCLTVAGSSPERFLRCDGDGWIEMKPIKGTLARPVLEEFGGDVSAWEREDERRKTLLEANEKDRAENLMIVDLIRNDLNLICDPKTVSVPHLMKVETYATVHQLVTTVKGNMRPNLSSLDAIRATFPPGSMTGAPKLRTCQILEDLEGHDRPRGPYSGCLGFLSVTGATDMSVVIRTAVFSETEKGLEVSVGAGGAVVFLSDPLGEFEEMLLKADSVLPR